MDCPNKWVSYLAWVEYAYNTSYHEGAQATPFELVYGRSPPSILAYLRGVYKLEAVDSELLARDELLRQLRANLRKAQIRMKVLAD